MAAADDTGQALCAAEARSDAQTDFRLAEFSVFSCIADIASAGEFAAAAESEAVDSCDDRLRQVFDFREDVLTELAPFAAFSSVLGSHFFDVSASDEGFSTCAGDDDDFDSFINCDFFDNVLQFADRSLVQGVQSFRTIDGDRCNTVFDSKKNVLVIHEKNLLNTYNSVNSIV